MEMVVSFLALGVALVAMWIGSTSMRKSDGDMTAFLLNARKELRATKTSIDTKVAGIEARVNTLDQLSTVMKTNTEKNKAAITKLQAEISGLRRDLDELDDSIPKQYRNPSARIGQPRVHQ